MIVIFARLDSGEEYVRHVLCCALGRIRWCLLVLHRHVGHCLWSLVRSSLLLVAVTLDRVLVGSYSSVVVYLSPTHILTLHCDLDLALGSLVGLGLVARSAVNLAVGSSMVLMADSVA